jgi:hypothetical protein
MTKAERSAYNKAWYADPDNRARKAALNREWQRQNPERMRRLKARHEAKSFGLTLAEYEELRKASKCPLCGSEPTGDGDNANVLHIDHCHATGRVRGVLCRRCNMMLGMATDDPELLRKAAAYIEHHRGLRT